MCVAKPLERNECYMVSVTAFDWPAERTAVSLGGIGGSEIAALVDLHPFADKSTIYRRKTGQEPPQPHTIDTLYGLAFESGVRTLYEFHTGKKVQTCDMPIIHPKYPIVRATPDGIIPGDRTLQIKCPRTMDNWGEEGTHDFPPEIWPQITWEMAVAGLQKADVVAKGFRDIVIYPNCPFDAELFEALREAAERFWRDCVIGGKAPKPGHADATTQWIKNRYPVHTQEELVVDDSEETMAIVAQYEKAKQTIKEAERVKAEAHNQLAYKIGGAAGITGTWGRVTYKAQAGRPSTDWKTLAANYGIPQHDIDRHSTPGAPYRVMRVKEAK